MTSAVRFAAVVTRDTQPLFINTLWELLPSPHPPTRKCIPLLASGLAPVLSPQQVAKRVVPVAVALLGDVEQGVAEAAVRLMVELYGMFAGEVGVAGRVQEELEVVIPSASHQVVWGWGVGWCGVVFMVGGGVLGGGRRVREWCEMVTLRYWVYTCTNTYTHGKTRENKKTTHHPHTKQNHAGTAGSTAIPHRGRPLLHHPPTRIPPQTSAVARVHPA